MAVNTTKRKSWVRGETSLYLSFSLLLTLALVGCGSSPSAGPSVGDFEILAWQPNGFLPIGFSSKPVQISVIKVAGFNQSVSVSVTGLPPGVTTTPNAPFTLAPGSSQNIVFNSTTGAQPGVQQITFQATSGSLSHNTTVTLSVAHLSYAYVATTASDGAAPFHLFGYAVEANTGTLSVVRGVPITLTDKAIKLVTTTGSGGTFLYALTAGNSPGLLAYRVDALTGTLTAIQQIDLGTTTGLWMTLHPSGRFLYLRHNDPNNSQMCVIAYLIDPNTGNLSQSSCTGEDAIGLVIPPPGNFAYLTDSNNSIKLYSADLNDGSLSSVQSQPLMQYSYIELVHPSGRALYTGQVQPPGSYYPNCTVPQIWSIDPQSGLLTSEGFYNYEFEYCWVSLSFMNLSGTFAYSYHQGPYFHDHPGWSLLKVGLNPPSLTDAGYPGYDPFACIPDSVTCLGWSLAEPTQGRYFVAYSWPGVLQSIPVDPDTGALSNPVSSITVGESLSSFVVVSPPN